MKSALLLKSFEANKIASKLEMIKGGKELFLTVATDTGVYDFYDDGSIEGPPVSPFGEV